MLLVTSRETGLPAGKYIREAVWPALVPALIVLPVVTCLYEVLPASWWRFIVIAAAGVVLTAVSIWNNSCLTPGEKAFILSKLKRK